MTAVEWYNSKIKVFENWVETKQISWKEYHKEKANLIKLANTMFENQIMKANEEGFHSGQSMAHNGTCSFESAKDYYNKTFKSE